MEEAGFNTFLLETKDGFLDMLTDEALKLRSDCPFKGNLDLEKFEQVIAKYGADNIPYVRMEAFTNLIGGQPFSMQNLREVHAMARKHGIMVLLDVSLVGENAWFIKQREPGYETTPIRDILVEMCGLSDMIYFSSRKVSCSRGGAIATNRIDLFNQMRDLVPLYEGFLTYGGSL